MTAAPQPDGKAGVDVDQLLEFMFRLGQAYLASGEQTPQVELTLRRIATAYGMRRARVVAFPTAIFISVHDGASERSLHQHIWSPINKIMEIASLVRAGIFADPTDWAPSLRKQLQAEEACQSLYMLNVKEYRFLNHNVIEARVYCEDGRMFDVTRRSPDMRFEFKECSRNTC